MWKKTLFAAGLAQVVSIMGFMFVVPFIPLYVRELGVVEDSAVRIWAGLLSAAVGLPMAFFSPIWGALADRFGRKLMVERATFGGAVAIAAIGSIVSFVLNLLIPFIGGLLATIAWWFIIKNQFDTGYWAALAIGIMAVIISVVISIAVAILFGLSIGVF